MRRTLTVLALALAAALGVHAPGAAQARLDWSKVDNRPATVQPTAPTAQGNATTSTAPTAKPGQPVQPPPPATVPRPEKSGEAGFPALTGRVVDNAHLLTAAQIADISSKSQALESATGRQFVVATVDSLQGRTIEDYGYRLGRAWGIGQADKDDGVILLVAPNERKVRIETGYGARVFLTDLVSSVIIRESILPAFRNGDMGGGIVAGSDQIIRMMQMPPAEAAKRAKEIAAAEQARSDKGDLLPAIFWMIIILFVILPMIRRAMGGGRRYRRNHRGGPIILWGPGWGGGSSWGGGGGSSWSDGGGFGGGFSGGGGSFGGGGASGSW